MRIRTVMAGALALAVVACTKPPLDEMQKTALADSLAQYVAGPMMAMFEHPNVDSLLALYAPGPDIQVAENGAIYADRAAIERAVRAVYGHPNVSARFTLATPRIAVLSRDAAVYTTTIAGVITDSTGVASPVRAAWTAVFVRVGGAWKLQAEHMSSPPAPPPAVPARAHR